MKPHTSLMSEPRLTRHARSQIRRQASPQPRHVQVDELAFRKFALAQGSRLPLFQAPGSEIDAKRPSVPRPA